MNKQSLEDEGSNNPKMHNKVQHKDRTIYTHRHTRTHENRKHLNGKTFLKRIKTAMQKLDKRHKTQPPIKIKQVIID